MFRTHIGMIRLTAVVPLLLAGGCATLPDLSGYTAATGEVRQSIAASGSAVSGELGRASLIAPDEATKAGIAANKVTFDAAWAKNVKALDAMVAYAESIEGIASAGNDGAKSAQLVADEVSKLAGSLGVPLAPVAAVADFVGDIGVKVYGEIAKIRAAKSLKEALAKSGPSIMALQTVVSANVVEAGTAFDQALKLQSDLLNADTGYGSYIAFDKTLRAREQDLVETLDGQTRMGARDPAIAATKTAMKAAADARTLIAPKLAEYEAKSAVLAERRKAGTQLIEASKAALDAWSAAHAKLVDAIEKHRPVTVSSLQAAVADIRDLVKRWHEL